MFQPQELHVQQNAIGDAGGPHIARALQTNSALRLLDLSANAIGYETCIVLDETLQARF